MSVLAGVTGTAGAVHAVFRNRDLRRVQLALLASLVGDGAYVTAVTVWAYGEGGVRAVGVFTAALMTASAVLAPVGGAVADRFSRRATLLACDGVRAALVASAALCLSLEGPLPVYVLAVAAGVLNAPFRTAQRAWMPTLTTTPRELTASNATSSTLESLAVFAGPALGGLLLAVSDVSVVFWLNVATFVVSMVLLLGVRERRSSARVEGATGSEGTLTQLVAGFRLLGADADLRSVTAQVAGQTFVGGAARVLLVVLAVDVMKTGPSGVGLLDAIIGVGAIAGGLVALARVERQRLGRDLALGVATWAAPLGLVVVWPHPVTVVAMLLLLGVASPLVDVNIDTIVQRMTPDALMARVFGALDTCYISTKALGAVATPLLLHLLGLRVTLVVVGAPVLLLALASWPRMGRLDGRLVPPAGLPLLRGVPWFAILAPAVLESLARGLREQQVPTGTTVITEGETGEDFYVIESGSVEVTQEGRHLRDQGPGEYFGEIALLNDIPRTATVTATTDLVLRVLDREVFLGALSGDGAGMASDVAASRLRHTG